MKILSQRTPELIRLGELIEDIPVAMLTTPGAGAGPGNGQALVSRPMAPLEMDAEGALWFFTDRRSSKVEHLQSINLSFADPAHGRYVSIAGHGELVDDRGRIERLWTAFAKPWFPDGPDSPELVLLKVQPHTAEVWDAPHSRMVRMFAMAASVVSGKPVGLGEHETLTDLRSR